MGIIRGEREREETLYIASLWLLYFLW